MKVDGFGPHAAQDWLQEYERGVEAIDAERVSKLFAPDAVFFETPFGPSFVGREEIREYWADVASVPRGIAYDWSILSNSGRELVYRWEMRVMAGASASLVVGVSIALFDELGQCNKLTNWCHRKDTSDTAGRH